MVPPMRVQQLLQSAAQVQGVYFRAHTAEQAQRLGLVGWCRNTKVRTVEGEIQGEAQQVDTMKVSSGCSCSIYVRCAHRPALPRLLSRIRTPCFGPLDLMTSGYTSQDWLQNVGSPLSRIDRLVSTEEAISNPTYDSFTVKRE